MKGIWGKLGTAAAVAGVASLITPACNHPDASLFIEDVLNPPAPATAGMGCLFPTPDPTAAALISGVLDLAVAQDYHAEVLVGNQLFTQADPEDDRAETSRIVLNHAIVTLTDAVGNPVDLKDSMGRSVGSSYSTFTNGFVDVGTSGTAGYGETPVSLFTGAASSVLADVIKNTPQKTRYISTFTIQGTTLGGTTITSEPYAFPIDVCYGCLINFADSVGPQGPGICDVGATTNTTVPCYLGQDNELSCSLCYNLSTACQVEGSLPSSADAGP